MHLRLTTVAMVGALAALPAGLGHAQAPVAPAQQPRAIPQAAIPPATVPPAAEAQAAPVPAPLPPPLWQVADAQQLLGYIVSVGREGLNPADYDPQGLTRSMASGDPLKMSAAATERFNKLSSDLALGHVRGEARGQWHVVDNDLDAERQDQLLRYALSRHQIVEALDGLLPTHPQYRDLKNALAQTAASDTAQADRLRLNLDRWRWLPRDLGEKYIIVNVPAFYVALVEKGETQWRQRAVAGAIKTPTPMLSVMATGVSLNPWWEIPKSIEPEVRGRAGYVALKDKNGKVLRWRQPPGPSNALGQLKFVMYNPHNIYLHDTNARSRFNSQIRSLSHGCIRTQNVVDLAKTIFADEGNEKWTPEKIDEVLASKKTVQADFDTPVPVYIVYFSTAASTDGRIINYSDIYKRDAKVIAALKDDPLAPVQQASKVAAR